MLLHYTDLIDRIPMQTRQSRLGLGGQRPMHQTEFNICDTRLIQRTNRHNRALPTNAISVSAPRRNNLALPVTIWDWLEQSIVPLKNALEQTR